MNRRGILFAALAAIVVLVGIAFFFTRRGDAPKERIVTIPAMPLPTELPDLIVHMGDKSTVYLRDLSGDIVLIFFNPECDHCQEQAREIAANKPLFEKWQVYFITSVAVETAEQFAANYRLTDANFKFGHSGVNEVYGSVGALNEVPTIIVYKSNRFVRKYEGLTSMELLKEVL